MKCNFILWGFFANYIARGLIIASKAPLLDIPFRDAVIVSSAQPEPAECI
jgi:hypothetical protein